jgi:hypothetical protein
MKCFLRLAVLSLLLCSPALAYEAETDTIIICDTQKQVERYAQLFDGDQQLAIRAVNTEANNPTACAVMEVAYVQGPVLDVARNTAHAFQIVPIVVIAAKTPGGFQRVKPAPAYTLIKIREIAV